MRAKAYSALRVAGAVLLCSGLAMLICYLSQSQSLEFRSRLPLFFLLVIVLVRRIAGEAGAILGTISAAIIFAFMLFQPLGSLGVAAREARSSLAWFLLGGMVCAHLLAPKKNSCPTTEFSGKRTDSE